MTNSRTTYNIEDLYGLSTFKELKDYAIETSNAKIAYNIVDHLYVQRHNIFGKWVSNKLGILYRDDVTAEIIISNLDKDLFKQIPPSNVVDSIIKTPDNFIVANNTLYLIDYKVRGNIEVARETIVKYKTAFQPLEPYLKCKIDVLVALYIPKRLEVILIPCDAFDYSGPYDFSDIITEITVVIEAIRDKWRDDGDFVRLSEGEYEPNTGVWCSTSNQSDFYQTPEWIEFQNTFKTPSEKIILGKLIFALELKPVNLVGHGIANQIIIEGHSKYKNMISEESRRLSLDINKKTDTFMKFKNPDQETLETAWSDLHTKLNNKFEYTKHLPESKPVIHSTWAPDTPAINELFNYNGKDRNILKIQKLSIILCTVQVVDDESGLLRMLGESMNMTSDPEYIAKYNTHLSVTKETKLQDKKLRKRLIEEKKRGAKINLEGEEIEKFKTINSSGKIIEDYKLKKTQIKAQIGDAIVYHNQEFEFTKKPLFQKYKRNLFKDAHIGGYIKSKDMTPDLFIEHKLKDGQFEKIKVFDFMDTICMDQVQEIMRKNNEILKEQGSGKIERGEITKILEGLSSDLNSVERKSLDKIMSTNYYKCSLDISELLRSAMMLSFSRNEKGFRCLVSGSKSTFLFLLPSDSITTRNSSVCYITLTIHERGNLITTGSEMFTKNIGHIGKDLQITVSRPMRLDKSRIKRLSNANYSFILTCLSFLGEKKSDVENHDLNDVMNFSLYMSMSASKSLMSLTEPARYIMMNSFSLCSDVYGYITDKFDPKCKTWFCAFVANKIKQGSIMAFRNRECMKLKSPLYFKDEALEFGVMPDETLQSLWFNFNVSIKQFLMEVYTPFYLNSKDLHSYNTNIVNLMKTPVEIESAIGNNWTPWGKNGKQKVDLDVFYHSVCEYYYRNKFRFSNMRNQIEKNSNFNKSIYTIDTMTSSKGCIEKNGKSSLEFEELQHPLRENEKILFGTEDNKRKKVKINEIKRPGHINITSRKVFDVLFEKSKNNPDKYNKPFSTIAFETMDEYKDITMSMFPKNQRTQSDREIYVGEFALKMCLYVIERIYKEQSSEDKTEQISKPGDVKLQILQRNRNRDMKIMAEMSMDRSTKTDPTKVDSTILEVNSDMTKWSAMDVFIKFILLIILDPNLYPDEKKHIIKFMVRYTHKKLVFPDAGMEVLLNQFDIDELSEKDILRTYLDGYTKNYIEVGQNWLQGNFNYTSSFVHSISMMCFSDINQELLNGYGIDSRTTSLVHSDDNQTTCIVAYNNVDFNYNFQQVIDEKLLSKVIMFTFSSCCLKFGNQVNTKKTNVNEVIKEFVSFFNLHGEPFSIYSRFLLPAIGDCAYLGPYEDLASRLSSIQSALRHGCSLETAKIGIAISTICSYQTYSMLKGQANDPAKLLNLNDRSMFPIELGGYPSFDMGLFASFGIEAHDITILSNIYQKLTNQAFKRNEILDVYTYDTSVLDKYEIFFLKYVRYMNLDIEATVDQTLGESYDMRTRSILTPRLYTTIKVLNNLVSYKQFTMAINSGTELLERIIAKPYLAIGKSENVEEYQTSILYRYFSNRFRESVSTQNSNQLFIEQSLQALEKTIDRECIDISNIIRTDSDSTDGLSLIGRLSISEAIKQIWELTMSKDDINQNDLQIILNHKFRTEPTIETSVNILNMFKPGHQTEKNNRYVVQMTQFATQRNIINTPSNIIRYYISRDMSNISNRTISEETLISDVAKLDEFALQIKLKDKLIAKKNRFKDNEQDKIKTQMFVITMEMQCLYSFLAQNIVRNRFMILPANPRTPLDFMKSVIGNTRNTDYYIYDANHKNVISSDAKGVIAKNKYSSNHHKMNILNAICTFISDYINILSFEIILHKIINNTMLNGVPIKDIIKEAAKSSINRQEIPGLFFNLGYLTDEDIITLKVSSDRFKITWLKGQSDYTLKLGNCEFIICNNEISLHSVLNGSKIVSMRLCVPNQRSRDFNLRKALNALERENLDIKRYYQTQDYRSKKHRQECVWFRYPTRNNMLNIKYLIATTTRIRNLNEDFSRNNETLWQFKCYIDVGETNKHDIDISSVKVLNKSSPNILVFKIDENRILGFKRIHKSILKDLDSLDTLIVNDIDLHKLLTTDFISNDTHKLKNINYYSIANIFMCSGVDNNEMDFDILSDADMFEGTSTDISSHLVPTIGTRTLSNKLSLKKTVKNCVESTINDFTRNAKVKYVMNDTDILCNMSDLIQDITTEDAIGFSMLTCRLQMINLIYNRLNNYKTILKKSKPQLFRNGGLMSKETISRIESDMLYYNMLHHYFKTNGLDGVFHSESSIKKKFLKNEMSLEINHETIQTFANLELDIINCGINFSSLLNVTFRNLLEMDKYVNDTSNVHDIFSEWATDSDESRRPSTAENESCSNSEVDWTSHP